LLSRELDKSIRKRTERISFKGTFKGTLLAWELQIGTGDHLEAAVASDTVEKRLDTVPVGPFHMVIA
jgi:hypothetical protein